MLYKKNQAKQLDLNLFQNPTSEYRGTPFWAWNCQLNREQMEEQIGYMKEMGFGGFHMHVRTGMATPYLSDEYMEYIRFCVEKAKSEEMLAWAYDEDRWPSGAAGGLVTKDPQYRSRYLLFTPVPYAENNSDIETTARSSAEVSRAENGRLLACYNVWLNQDGSLQNYEMTESEADIPSGAGRWYAYLEIASESPWYNGQAYLNTLDKKAVERFVEVTHERYAETVGEAFGNVIPSIFTDEPQFPHKKVLPVASAQCDLIIPWTEDFENTFSQTYGESILAHLPQVFWEQENGAVSRVRYWYHDHIAERFASAFADTIGGWCKQHGLALTGHMMEEPSLRSQTAAVGEAMRSYRSFQLPGIDMLCDQVELSTAKQAQSAVHQYGYEGMLSELYGVTGWDFDFRGHKFQGDWQAALGVTIRVPHLAWMSMAGEAKRDYPASIFYQSPWYQEYANVEDHFSRVNTALTRGKPLVRVGVIHPVESYWLHWGPNDETGTVREALEEQFGNTLQWLLFGGIDFDYICESLLPSQCSVGGAPLKVGEMAYDAIVVSGCETLRSTTIERLKAFADAGGTLIMMGEAPRYVDAVPSEEGKALAAKAQNITAGRAALLEALKPFRFVQMNGADGSMKNDLIYQLRQDGEARWLFVAHAVPARNKDLLENDVVRFTLDGCWKPTLYNTADGTTKPIAFETTETQTVFRHQLYSFDSMLVKLEPCSPHSAMAAGRKRAKTSTPIRIPNCVPVTLSEPNVLLLDRAAYALDNGEWREAEEILRADNQCRKELGWPGRGEAVVQPWAREPETVTHTMSLRFVIESEIVVSGAKLAIEDAERVTVIFNGETVGKPDGGFYVDKAIRTIPLPAIQQGENVLEVTIPFGRTTDVEWCYILGDFGVRVFGTKAVITPPVRELAFDDVVHQGLPFYGGNITYHIPFTLEQAGDVHVVASRYRGGLMRMEAAGDSEAVIYPPYAYRKEDLAAGEHTLNLTLYGNRYNAFGWLHLCDPTFPWCGPNAWRTSGDVWTDGYCFHEMGVLNEPTVSLER